MTWYFSITPSARRPGQFVAMAKQEPISGDGQPENEPGNIWTDYDENQNLALQNLFRQLPEWRRWRHA